MANMRPTNREETLLAKIAGESYEVEPRNAQEYWLNKIAESRGGGGASVSKVPVVVSGEDSYIDVKYSELASMLEAGIVYIQTNVSDNTTYHLITDYGYDGEVYIVTTSSMDFEAETQNDKPALPK